MKKYEFLLMLINFSVVSYPHRDNYNKLGRLS